MKKILYCALSLSVVSIVYAQTCNPNITRTAPDSRYELVVGSSGVEVLDKQTGLIWQRCSLGQSWDGTTCTGAASTHTWADALTKAKALGNGYRLPNIKELHSLTEKACVDPAINEQFFPNTTTDWYRSASPYANYGGNVWLVNFQFGLSYHYNKHNSFYVRAVRTGQ